MEVACFGIVDLAGVSQVLDESEVVVWPPEVEIAGEMEVDDLEQGLESHGSEEQRAKTVTLVSEALCPFYQVAG